MFCVFPKCHSHQVSFSKYCLRHFHLVSLAKEYKTTAESGWTYSDTPAQSRNPATPTTPDFQELKDQISHTYQKWEKALEKARRGARGIDESKRQRFAHLDIGKDREIAFILGRETGRGFKIIDFHSWKAKTPS